MYFYNQDSPSSFDASSYFMEDTSQILGEPFEEYYDDSSFLNFDMQSHSLPDSLFLPLAEQTLLYSDPNFLKQQQLLEKAKEDVSVIKEEAPVDEGVLRSNLSAMFDQQKPKKKTVSSKNTTTNFGEGSVDHNRRFSELQARFRVHYNTKKSPKLDENALLNRRKSPLELSLNKNILKLNSREKKATSSPKKVANIALSNPSVNNDPSSPAAYSFPSRTMPIQIQRVHRNNAQPYDLEQRQKKLDDQLVKADFNDITVSELKEMLRQRGKPATGKKAILLQRLQEERDFIQHSRENGIPISSRYLQQSPVIDSSSLPESMFLSNSPASLGSLNRSIADMRIGSPPPNALTIPSSGNSNSNNRRFTPYTSPRNSLSSPSYSTSVPSSIAGGHVFKKSYAPFTSSALATPDRDDDYNPFDSTNMNNTEWSDPSIESMMHESAPKLTNDDFASFLVNQSISDHHTLDEQLILNHHHQ